MSLVNDVENPVVLLRICYNGCPTVIFSKIQGQFSFLKHSLNFLLVKTSIVYSLFLSSFFE